MLVEEDRLKSWSCLVAADGSWKETGEGFFKAAEVSPGTGDNG